MEKTFGFSYDCINCAIGSLITLFDKGLISDEHKDEAMRKLLQHLSTANYLQSPVHLGKSMHRTIRNVLNNPDPYREIKKESNATLMDYYPVFKHEVLTDADPFQLALRMALAGNIIDFGPNHRFDWKKTMDRARSTHPAIDHSAHLKEALKNTETLLYIGDNAGEIVMDRILLETIDHSNTFFAVRGSPIINDITIQDATDVGIDKIATIISNGDDAPGILLDSASAEFREIFERADLIISKGQGNFEGLVGCGKNIYYLLIAKCDHVAEFLDVKKGDFILSGEKYRFSVA